MRDRPVDGDKHPVDAEIIRCHESPTECNRTTTRVPVVAMARQQGVWYRLNPVDGVNHPALPLGFDDCRANFDTGCPVDGVTHPVDAEIIRLVLSHQIGTRGASA